MTVHRARKRFGQHFLIDPMTIGQIIDIIDVRTGDELLEIGPGQGALTVPLARQAAHLTVIEIDRDLTAALEQRFADTPNLTIIQGNALEIDVSAFAAHGRLRVVGNLPYNISTPLLVHLLGQLDAIRDMHFMLQKEVVDRVCAVPGSSDYGRLSVLLQSQCRALSMLDVPATAFSPPPKVESSILRLLPLDNQPQRAHLNRLSALTQLAFSQRRKMIRKSLRPLFTEEALCACGIDPDSRPQDVPVSAYLELAHLIPSVDKPAH